MRLREASRGAGDHARHGFGCATTSAAIESAATALHAPGMSLFWRVFFVNTALLVVGALVLALTPMSVSAEIRLAQATVLAVGVAVMLVANLLLLRPLFAPLERLARRMEELDVLRAARPVPEASAGEIGALECRIVVVGEAVDSGHAHAGLQQTIGQSGADEPGGTGDERVRVGHDGVAQGAPGGFSGGG